MRAVVQRVENASVEVSGEIVGRLDEGLLVYLGVGKEDTEADVRYLADKVANLRIYTDEEGKMNLSTLDTGKGVMVVSQFTLYADARKGRRPSYNNAAYPEAANELYLGFVGELAGRGIDVATGQFQAIMRVKYENIGPVTILLDSNKEF